MERNFLRPLNCAPILDKKLKHRVIEEGLQDYLHDNVLAWQMDGTGHYTPKKSRARPLSVQQQLLDQLAK